LIHIVGDVGVGYNSKLRENLLAAKRLMNPILIDSDIAAKPLRVTDKMLPLLVAIVFIDFQPVVGFRSIDLN